MRASLRQELADQAAALFGVELDAAALGGLEAYVRELVQWSQRFNLISFRDEEELVRRHVLDSLAPIRLLGDGEPLIDVGSGGGLPGVPIAIATKRPVTLIEARRKRSNFLRHAVRTLDLVRVRVVEARAESADLGPCPAVVSRAVPAEVAIAAALRWLGDGGVLLLMIKGEQAVESPGLVFEDSFRYELPGGWCHQVARFRRRFT